MNKDFSVNMAEARRQEQELAAKHEATRIHNERTKANQDKNGAYYNELKNGKKMRLRIYRQCAFDEEHMKYTMTNHSKFTYMMVQYFENTGKGKAGHVLKVTWSTHPDKATARDKRYQTTTWFNLYKDREITRRAKKYHPAGEEFGHEIRKLEQSKDILVSAGHIAPYIMYGICAIHKEKHGTVMVPNHYAIVKPSSDRTIGADYLKVTFVIGEEMLHVDLKDVTNRGYRKDDASMFVGYKR